MLTHISSGSPFEATIGYSRAVVDGDMIYVSGTTGYDYSRMVMPDDVGEQARNALQTIAKALEEAGSSLTDVLRVRYYLSDVVHYNAVVPVLGDVFGAIRPAATMVVCGLVSPEMKIEIEVTARRGAGSA
ncbi:enamine deaminase RidA (YjgF/YER057c/UK114 family) [Neorhizobium galegae]|uniref:RidA family protein n=1 Tax=Neorhizobium galegae TaxID=399 RepID=UPI001AE839E6|nr:RidA family protein [Neorhizobium galegae]MBP2551262.1 enamine deaminase RidA (YjgF/YER057c/UK114 family) [Neorhizobium galegae]